MEMRARRTFPQSFALCAGAGVAVVAAILATAAGGAAASPPSSPSGIGSENVLGIAIAPDFVHSGLAAVQSTPLAQCSSDCHHLWVTHDGGATWHRPASRGWNGVYVNIGRDKSGNDVLFDGLGPLQISTDGGEDWTTIAGPTGFTSVAPSFGSDGSVAIAGVSKGDYLYRDGKLTQVTGSGGAYYDYGFMFAPSTVPGSPFAPVLLSASDDHASVPYIEQCDTSLKCSTPVAIANAGPFAVPVSLLPSADYGHDGTVFARAGRQAFKSITGGASFTPLTIVSDGATVQTVPMMALAPGYAEHGAVRTAYAAIFEEFTGKTSGHTAGGVFQSTDGGATWARLGSPSPLDNGADAVAVAPNGRLFAGYLTNGAAGLLCSGDGGASWQASCSPLGDHTSTSSQRSSGTCTAACSVGADAHATSNGNLQPGETGATGPHPDGGPTTGSAAQSRNTAAHAGSTLNRGALIAAILAVLLLIFTGVQWVRRRSQTDGRR